MKGKLLFSCFVMVTGLNGTLALAEPFDITDLANRTTHFDKAPQKFIVGNYIANFMAVGGGGSTDKIIGLTKDGWEQMRYGEYKVFTDSFPILKTLPSIGGYHDDILNVEKILSLKPDVLLIGKSQYVENNQRIKLLEKAGVKVIVLDYHSMKIGTHTKSTEILGKLLGRTAVANEQNQTYKDALNKVFSTIDKLPDSEKQKRVYFETASKGVARYGNSYNKDVLWGAILHQLKAKNLAENSHQPYLPLDKEFVISQNPQYIFLGGSIWGTGTKNDQMRMGFTVDQKTSQQRLKNFLSRPGWDKLDAVKNGKVFAVDHGSLRNMGDYTFTEYIAKSLYPEAFKDLDPQKNLADYYRKYLPELKYNGTFMIQLDSAKAK